MQERLSSFHGVKRRFSVAECKGHIIIDDYAHHPTEIKATLQSAKQKYPDKDIIAVFQPHTFTRTAALLDEFAKSLSEADHVYLCDIFSSAREQEGSLTIEELIARVPDAQYLALEDTAQLDKHGKSVYLFMGAGDIQKYLNNFKLHIHKNETAS